MNYVKKIVLIALYTALMVILSVFCSINMYEIKITLQNLPLIVAAVTLGTGAGAFVGFMGSFLIQLLTYGFTATTLIWVLPHTIVGLLIGIVFEKKLVNTDDIVKNSVCVITAQILITLLNTVAMYVDSIIFGYYSFVVIFGTLIMRLMISIITGIIYCIVLPIIIKSLKKIH